MQYKTVFEKKILINFTDLQYTSDQPTLCLYFSNSFIQPRFIGCEEGVLGIIPRFFPYPHLTRFFVCCIKSILVGAFSVIMVTGIGYCGRRGQRKRERQLRTLSDHPEKFIFYPPPRKRNRRVCITGRDGKKTSKRY